MAKSLDETKAESRTKATIEIHTSEPLAESQHVVDADAGKNNGNGDEHAEHQRPTGRPSRRSSPQPAEVLPHSLETEEGILAIMMNSPAAAVPVVQRALSPSQFYVSVHRVIVQHLFDLWENERAADFISLGEHLERSGDLVRVGGRSELVRISGLIHPIEILPHWIAIVRDRSAAREAIEIAAQIDRIARDTDDAGEIAAIVQQQAERLALIAKPRTRLPELRDLSTILGHNKPARPPELISGILHQGSKLIIGGTSKGRKTYSLLDLAVSVATGRSWWGFECTQGPVCYINFEIQEAFFAERTETICEKKGVSLDPNMLVGWNLRGHGEGIENLTVEILTELRKHRFVLIIVDPIYKALGDRDENKAGDVASMLNELERIAVTTGAAIAFGAHYSKGNQAAKESIDRIGGSGVFARDPDSILTMTAHEEPEAFIVEATLRNFKPIDPFVVKWDWPLFQRDPDLDPSALKQPRKAGNSGQFAPKYTKEMLLNELSVLDGMRPPQLKKLMDELHGMSKTHFYRFAQDLHRAGLIVEKDGQWFKGAR